MLLAGDVVLVHVGDVGDIEAVAHPLDLVNRVGIHQLDHLVRHQEPTGVNTLGLLDSHRTQASIDVLGITVLEDSLDVLAVALEVDGVASNIIVRKTMLAQKLEDGLGTSRNLLGSKVAVALATAMETGERPIASLLELGTGLARSHDLEVLARALWKDNYHITNQG